jgi:hypothetical protein
MADSHPHSADLIAASGVKKGLVDDADAVQLRSQAAPSLGGEKGLVTSRLDIRIGHATAAEADSVFRSEHFHLVLVLLSLGWHFARAPVWVLHLNETAG